ncbi:MAG: sodium/sugar symporter [Bacteroidales bacterium]|jgi:SSS family solute:Na+ symporter|nr:sodium/sugar symporter [Bacteroidales bacterium]
MENFAVLDFVIVAVYAVLIIGLGFFFSRSKGKEKSTEDYFLAGKSLPWWAIGASLIAANISAEQYIGMSGSGFASGLAIASYEFMAALTLIIVGKFFLPIFIKQGIYTIPEFVERRFSTNLKTILAVFWLALFIFVNLTSILFLGGKAIDTIVGTGDGSLIMPAIFILAIVAVAYSLYGGLSAVAWTDVIQVILLVLGGVVTTVFALKAVSPDSSIVNGISHVTDVAGDKFDMILSRDNPEYSNLPGIYVLIGGLWVANLYYWGFNQYIIQRTLAAKSISEAQHGIVFAAFLKMLIPFIIVIPGIIAWVMYSEGYAGATEAFELPDGTLNNDKAFPWLISTLLPTGLKGLVLAALSAAIVSSLASMLNSISTIFTMDIYKPYVNPTAESKKYVNVGRITAVVALFVAIVVSPLLSSMDQMFQYIQEYTGLVSPGILAVFIMGLFWKKATNKGAVWGILLSIPIALAFKILPFEMPFMDQMFYTFLFTMVIIMMVSLTSCPTEEDEKGIPLTADLFKTDKVFNICAYIICVLLAVIYTIFF